MCILINDISFSVFSVVTNWSITYLTYLEPSYFGDIGRWQSIGIAISIFSQYLFII